VPQYKFKMTHKIAIPSSNGVTETVETKSDGKEDRKGIQISSMQTFWGEEKRAPIYVRKDGTFFIKINESVSTILYPMSSHSESRDKQIKTVNYFQSTIEANTLEDLKSFVKSEGWRYRGLLTKREKVIRFGFQANVYIHDEKADRCLIRREDMSFSESPALEFWYDVGYICEYKGRKEYHNLDNKFVQTIDDAEETNNRGYKTKGFMPYTKKRAEYFERQEEQLKAMILNAHMFFETTAEEKQKMIDSHKGVPALDKK
jgi:hypothetical protein